MEEGMGNKNGKKKKNDGFRGRKRKTGGWRNDCGTQHKAEEFLYSLTKLLTNNYIIFKFLNKIM